MSCLQLAKSRTVKNANGQSIYRATLQQPKLKQFQAKRLTVTKAELDLWDLHSFQRPASSKPKSKDRTIPVVEQLDATSIDLDFSTKEKRERFEDHFKFISNARCKQIEQFKAGRKVAASKAHKPTRKQSYTAGGFRRDSVAVISETTIDEISQNNSTYVLDMIPRFSVIDMNDPDAITPDKKFG